jgi:hypothetical protein
VLARTAGSVAQLIYAGESTSSETLSDKRQIGHASITTTQRYYGHFERNVLAASATEEEMDRLTKRAA